MIHFIDNKKGTAMGTKFAPVYPTLTIGFLEEKLYTIIETNYDTEFQRYLKNIAKDFWTTALFHGPSLKRN